MQTEVVFLGHVVDRTGSLSRHKENSATLGFGVMAADDRPPSTGRYTFCDSRALVCEHFALSH